MTRRQMEAIAAALKASKPDFFDPDDHANAIDVWMETAIAVRDTIGQFNPNFDAKWFNKAARIAAESE